MFAEPKFPHRWGCIQDAANKGCKRTSEHITMGREAKRQSKDHRLAFKKKNATAISPQL